MEVDRIQYTLFFKDLVYDYMELLYRIKYILREYI